jgi:outer membrane protein assembly factor BamB
MRALPVVALAALLGACSGASGPKPAELPRLQNAPPVRQLWSVSVGSAETFVFSPALVDGSVYAAGHYGTVLRVDAANGREIWRASAGMQLSGGVGADARTVAVASDKGDVLALDAETGKPRWRARVSSEVLAAPAVGAGLVVVRSLDNRVFAFEAADGKRRWVYQRPAASLVIRTPAGVALEGDTAFAAFAGGKLAAIALSNGGQRWEATVSLPKGATELERVTDVVGEPAVQGREVCAASYQGRVACYEASSGRQVWAREISSITGVSLDARYAFVADDRGAVQAFDRSSGRSVWKQDKLAHRQLSAPAPLGELVAVGDFEGYVHFLERESGAFVTRFDAGDGYAVRAVPLALPGGARILVQTQGGGLHALAL